MVANISAKNRNPLQSKNKQLKDQITKLKTSTVTMHKEGFKYFEKLLAGKLKLKQEKIVNEVYDSQIHITLNGKRVERPAQQTLEALPLCYKHMLWACTNNAAA